MQQSDRRVTRFLPWAALAAATLFLPGCSSASDEAAEPRANVASGRVTGPRGEPLAGVVVKLRGTSLESGERSSYDVRTDTDGRYAIELPPGQYRVNAQHTVEFDGSTYDFALHPTDEDPDRTHDSRTGFTKDFVWKLAGQVPGRESSRDQHFAHYGGAIDVSMSVDGGWQNPEPLIPVGTRVRVELAPETPLVDGSAGEPLVFETEFTGSPNYVGGRLFDIPVAVYGVTAEAVLPGGETRPLLVELQYSGADPAPRAKLRFEPDPGSNPGVEQAHVRLTLPE